MGFEPTTARDHWILTGFVDIWDRNPGSRPRSPSDFDWSCWFHEGCGFGPLGSCEWVRIPPHWILTGFDAFWYCPQVQSNHHVEPTATTTHQWLWILVSHGEVWRFRRRSLYMGIEPKYQQLQSKSNGK